MKIFGIGLPRTGTTSLNTALKMLGFRSLHFPRDQTTVEELRAGNYRLSILDKYDALTDIPVPAIFAQLDQIYPNSKFILTDRDMEPWLDSCNHAWFNQSEAIPKPGSMREFYRTLLYGCNVFNRDRFQWVYQSHLKLVQEHFTGKKSEQLLVLNVAEANGWEKLCPFLGVDIPDSPFPHKNKFSPEQLEKKELAPAKGSKFIRTIRNRFFGTSMCLLMGIEPLASYGL